MEQTKETTTMMTAAYSPDDNKLRLSASSRLDKETYERVRAAGFIWAPKQGVFVAPAWSPEREDLLIELCGEVGDEDTSLMDRAEQRSERFEEYSDNRMQDAEQARAAVSRIADGIPLGQPILVGHHSEKHARRDAKRIEDGMRKTVRMWECSKYWTGRAASAIRHAKYKERPDVRMRRIKGLESEVRCLIAGYTPRPGQRPMMQQRWNAAADAPEIPHVYVGPAGRGGRWVAQEDLPKIEAGSQRWLQHLRNRIEYERAMLADGGGLTAERFDIQVGGRVCRRGQWFVVVALNKRDGALKSVSVAGHWCSTVQIEEITDYREPAEGDAVKVKAATKLAPLVNFRAPGSMEMTTAEWKKRLSWSDTYYVAEFTAEGVYNSKWDQNRKVTAYRQRTMSGGGLQNYTRVPVFLTDAKVVEPPKQGGLVLEPEPETSPCKVPEHVQHAIVNRVLDECTYATAPVAPIPDPKPDTSAFEAMRQSLKGGVKVVSVPQLFPTPPALAARMVELSGLQPMERVLEPSAGTGNLVAAVRDVSKSAPITAVELNYALADGLRKRFDIPVLGGDFLEQNGNLGKFDVILMNPPFANGQDIQHIQHAVTHLKPGGRLVAICADGPRQNETLRPLVDDCGGEWEQLEAGTFAGTGVRAVLLTMVKS